MTLCKQTAMALLVGFAVVIGNPVKAQSTNLFDCVIKPREIIQLGSAVEGVLIERPVERGVIVEAGQVVARLDDVNQQQAVRLARLEAERDIEVRSRQAAAKFRANETVRIADLANRNLTAKIEVGRAELEQRLSELALEAARMDQAFAQAELELAETVLGQRTIRSSVAGVITETNAAPGDYINAQSVILTLARLDILNVEVFLPTDLFGLPVEGSTATVLLDDPIGGSYKAMIETVDRVFDAASGTFGVRLTIPNSDYALPAGLRCKVSFGSS